jgi:predicted GIY-YIG superfamily endonuclease
MADENVCVWPGRSGKEYRYWVYPFGRPLQAKPGNYIFAKLNSKNQWEPIYIGETDDLDSRVADHEKRERARTHGMTHIHAHLTSGDRSSRLAEETDLRKNFNPPCNDQ